MSERGIKRLRGAALGMVALVVLLGLALDPAFQGAALAVLGAILVVAAIALPGMALAAVARWTLLALRRAAHPKA